MLIRTLKICIFIIVCSALCMSSSCSKDDRIPYVPVNIELNLNNPEFNMLRIPNNYEYITGGVKGIIVYCAYQNDYRAYERNCPYKPFSENAFLKVDSTEMYLVCASCDSKFLLYDGTVVEGPSNYSVLRYETYLEVDILYIYNHFH